MFNVSDGTRPCSECVWNSAEGCTKWVCEPLTRKEVKEMLKERKAFGEQLQMIKDVAGKNLNAVAAMVLTLKEMEEEKKDGEKC